MKKYQMLFALLLLCSVGFAQSSVGLRTGVNFNNVLTPDLVDFVYSGFDELPAFEAAILLESAVTPSFSILSELGYVGKGFQIQETVDVNLFGLPIPFGAKVNNRFDYIQASVMPKFSIGNDFVRLFGAIGPTLGYAVGGQSRTRATALLDFNVLRTDIPLDAINYNRWEVGMKARVGVEADMGTSILFADATYQRGFTDLYRLGFIDTNIRNTSIGFGAGIKVPL